MHTNKRYTFENIAQYLVKRLKKLTLIKYQYNNLKKIKKNIHFMHVQIKIMNNQVLVHLMYRLNREKYYTAKTQ